MSNVKISQLPNATTPLAGTEAVPIVQSGATVQVPASAFGPSTTSPLLPPSGGTGIQVYAVGDLLYASGTTTLARLADVATGNVLLSGGVGVAPSYGKVNLASAVTGTLPIANGGSGQTTANAALNAFLPTQTTNAGKFLQTDGTNTSWQTAAGGGGGRTILTLNPAPNTDTEGYNICNLAIAAGTLTATDVLHVYAAGYITFNAIGNVDVDLDLSLNAAALFPRIRVGVNVAVTNATNSIFYFEAYCPAATSGQSNGFMFFDTANVNTFPSPNEACQAVVNSPAVTPLVFYGLQDGPYATDLTQAFNARLQLRDVNVTTPPTMTAGFHGTSYIEVLSV